MRSDIGSERVKIDFQEIRWKAWSGMIWLRIGSVASCCEHGVEHSGYVKCMEPLALLRNL
jgi:hypothetical protein